MKERTASRNRGRDAAGREDPGLPLSGPSPGVSPTQARPGRGAGALTLALGLCLAACERAPRPGPVPATRSQPDPGVRAPFVLRLAGPERPQGGAVPLLATLTGHGNLPIDLDLELPAGAALLEGQARERVLLTETRPAVERRYLVRLGGPPSLAQPIRLRARLSDPALGALAERTYPPPAAAPSPPPPTAGETLGRLPIGTPVPTSP